MKIKELKEAIKDLPDDLEVIVINKYDGEKRQIADPKVTELWRDKESTYFGGYESEDTSIKEKVFCVEEY